MYYHGQVVLEFLRKIRIQFLNYCKGKYHLLVCVKQMYKFGDHLEIILITLNATENLSPLGRKINVLKLKTYYIQKNQLCTTILTQQSIINPSS
jgi:hypothetical protein